VWLTDNQIGDKGAQYLGEALQNNTVRYRIILPLFLSYYISRIHVYYCIQTLTQLYLGDNQIGDKGAQYFGEGLQQNTVRERITRYPSISHSSLSFHIDTSYTPALPESNSR
jgi:hypothetical protein